MKETKTVAIEYREANHDGAVVLARVLPYITLIIAMTCLAAGGIFVRLSELGPITTAFYRITFSVPITVVLIQLTSSGPQRKFQIPGAADLCFLGLAGAALAMDLILWHISFLYTTIANANLLANMVSFFIIPFSFLVLKKKPTGKFVVACFVATVGIVVLMMGKSSFSADNAFGDFLALLTAVFYATYFILVSKYRADYSALEIILWSSYGSLLCLFPFAWFCEDAFFPKTMEGLLVLFGVACLSHVGGQGLMAFSLGKIPLHLSALLVLMQPVIAGIFSFAIFRERLTAIEIFGFAIILSSIYIAKK